MPLKLQVSCNGGIGGADPAIRLSKLVSLFDRDRALFLPICAPDLSENLTVIGETLASLLGSP